ncbi:MAG: acyl carrier protein [Patescibacteria group bacterium]
MIQQQEVEIIKAIAEALGLAPAEMDRNASLRDDLALGPLDLNDIIESMQRRFRITFEPEDITNVRTVNDLIILVEDNLIA